MPKISVLAIVWAFLAPSIAYDSIIDEAVVPFFIPAGSKNVVAAVGSLRPSFHSESREAVSPKVFCEFSYTTEALAQAVKDTASSKYMTNRDPSGKTKSRDEVLDRLFGMCVRKTLDYWTYEICFGNKATQSHGAHSIDLGHYSLTSKEKTQEFGRGSACEALPHEGFPPRTSSLVLGCGERFDLVLVEEVATCSYRFVVSSPVACGAFPDVVSLVGDTDLNSEAGYKLRNRKDEREHWLLELFQLDFPQDQIVCRAIKKSDTTSSEKIEFAEFSLKIRVEDGGKELKLLPVKHMTRNNQRTDLDLSKAMYRLQAENHQTQLTLLSSQGFEGDIAIASIQAFPKIES